MSTEAAAAQAEATSQSVTVTFEGHTYSLLEGQPSPRALTYLAKAVVDEENLAMILYLQEVVGAGAWLDWCRRHKSSDAGAFATEIGKALSGN